MEFITKLESNNPDDVQFARQKFHDLFGIVREPWLLNGIYDYYLSSNSVRSMEILCNVKEPHNVFLFDKLSESIRGSKNDIRIQALTLLGHVIRRQPPWLYKITEHQVFKDLLKLLKNDMDILPLVSALLVLVVLLPIIPSLMKDYLPDVFEIFSRLAAWNCNTQGRYVEEQVVHMQVALYALFQRLYGMYPCNFVAFLRNQYKEKNVMPIFTHTVKPMLETVRMHPFLITASKDNETTTARWKKMGVHDVIVECERLSLEFSERCPHDTCHFATSFRSRSGTTNSATFESPYQLPLVRNASLTTFSNEMDFFSPSLVFQCQTPPVAESAGPAIQYSAHLQSQAGTSPPEAAIEATPETTPVKDIRPSSRPYQSASTVAKALNTFGGRNWPTSGTTTPTHSQPSSPMRKEASPFNFPSSTAPSAFAYAPAKRETYASQKLQRLFQDRNQVDLAEPQHIRTRPPTSPLRIIHSNESATLSNPLQRIESPVSQEDEEVVSIVRQGEGTARQLLLRQCDSVLKDVERGDDDLEECEQEQGSPCTAGGLHMPNSRSMYVFKKQVRRLRYHSQCAESESNRVSTTGSSPGDGDSLPPNMTVRRANSCPEMKKTSPALPTKDNNNSIAKPLDETDEEGHVEARNGVVVTTSRRAAKQMALKCSETQTENFWPMPYEHLFLGIFPSLESQEVKPSPAPSPAPMNEKFCPPVSVNEILDKYIEKAAHSNDRDVVKNQLQLLHQQLLFERHRRETHAYGNRRLLADARSIRAFEEHNSALRDQVQLQQKDIDSLREELDSLKKSKLTRDKQITDKVEFWENQYKLLQDECKNISEHNSELKKEIEQWRGRCGDLEKKWQIAESALLYASTEVKLARELSLAAERGKGELEIVNRQLLLAGELNLKYKERLADLQLYKRSDFELGMMRDAHQNDIKNLKDQLESKSIALEAYRTRVAQLEQIVNQHTEEIVVQKHRLTEIKEEYHEIVQAVENKYKTQAVVNRCLEEKILELMAGRPVHSPDTSSCHEVQVATGSVAAHSPLSGSLPSSEGEAAADSRNNSQVVVDSKDTDRPQFINEPGPSAGLRRNSASKND